MLRTLLCAGLPLLAVACHKSDGTHARERAPLRSAANTSLENSAPAAANGGIGVEAALAATSVNPAAWPAPDCATPNFPEADQRLSLLYEGESGDGEGLSRMFLKPGAAPSPVPAARLVAACIAARKGEHAGSMEFLRPLADKACPAGALILSNLHENAACQWSSDAIELAKEVKSDGAHARQLAAIAALRSGEASAIRNVLAPMVTMTFDCSVCEGDEAEETTKSVKLPAAKALEHLASTADHHLELGYLVGCTATSCTFTSYRLTHSSSAVHSITVEPKTGKITNVVGTDG